MLGLYPQQSRACWAAEVPFRRWRRKTATPFLAAPATNQGLGPHRGEAVQPGADLLPALVRETQSVRPALWTWHRARVSPLASIVASNQRSSRISDQIHAYGHTPATAESLSCPGRAECNERPKRTVAGRSIPTTLQGASLLRRASRSRCILISPVLLVGYIRRVHSGAAPCGCH